MILHNDKDAFRVLLERIGTETGHREDVLEKDYYVTLILKELSTLQEEGLPAYFKGGTALYKALKKTNRFSEDIDLSVDTRGCSRTQNDRRLEQATKKYKSLKRDAEQGITNRSEVIQIYLYDSVTSFDKDDALQRFGRVKIEATSFTISEPVDSFEIAALIYEAADDETQAILRDKYEVAPFNIQAISLERLFIDKLFAAESYTRKSQEVGKAFEAAKHIYDLSVMADLDLVKNLMNDKPKLSELFDIRIEEEKERLDGILGVMPKEFTFFDDIASSETVARAYEIMQNQYVLLDEDRISFAKAVEKMKELKQIIFPI